MIDGQLNKEGKGHKSRYYFLPYNVVYHLF